MRPVALMMIVAAPVMGQPARAPRPTVEHTWTPVRAGEQVTAIRVRTVLRDWPDSTGRALSLNVPIIYAGVRGIAERTEALLVTDRAGPVPFRTEDEPADPGGFPHFRHFRFNRSVTFPVTIEYRAVAPAEAPRAPPFGLYATAGGVTGAGAGFLVLPEWSEPVESRVHWDLSELAAGSIAAGTFGLADFTLTAPPDELRQGWIMAGPLGHYPVAGSAAGFTAFWLGQPSWDPAAEMGWAARMYRFLARSYRYLDPPPPYRVFIRTGPTGSPASWSGTALGASFLMGALIRESGAAAAGMAPRETITHEMGHLFVGGIEAPTGVGSWFSEGLNTYYTRVLLMRGGFTPFETYRAEVNRAFAEYYRSPARNLSADSIVRIGFGDEDVRHLPYVRGSLYFADFDAKIRAHSKGRRDLDRVLRELFVRRRRGTAIDHAVWIAVVEREAGPDAREDFEGIILRGDRTLVPAPDAFGAGLTRREIRDSTGTTTGYEWVTRPSQSTARRRP